ncbi:F0F1 ATP synthase subunit B [Formosa algae]|uniref:ATP synthase subunit b n=1 Tax=Formosa algae TaxID=225843 RepID=A0A9X0YJT1_9FLAO|nr:F0F1 ATP synthase subunit B [Formosa algae]MBP1838572.1 F-type H+-transporting ATPase subunit b [Formosa algae]MDQ0335072.1 F-type H+-transporting ATPase subunit b [Formosa algae]OEI79590.1 ATP synthase F0 subunit B [Formosa algae]PNW30259.1 ATP synthase F0 subunit B [Formosa algae]
MDTLLNDFSPGLFIMQTIILIILIVLLGKFAWKPILGSLATREDGIKDAIEAAEKAKLELQNLQADNAKLLNEARVERDAMLKEAREMKDKMILDAKDEAQVQANNMIEAAKHAIESEKKTAMVEIKNHVAELSLEIAEKVVRGELSNKDKQLQLVDTLLGESTLN